MLKDTIKRAIEGGDLSAAQAREAMEDIMDGRATPAQIAAFLTALRMKSESIEEITASAQVMRERCTHLQPPFPVLEIVGTGGDGAFTFNISTVTAFVVAAAGVPVAKHGNRSVSSLCGSADVLEALGASIDVSAAHSERMLREQRMCFLFAPKYHLSMKHAAPVRKDMGVRTLFNLLGPLCNPAGATMQLLGVYDESLVVPMAHVLRNLGVRRAMVVHGHDGLDEITMTAPTTVCEVNGDAVNSFFLDPRRFGFALCDAQALRGGNAAENAAIARAILAGERGAKRDIVVMNAAVCLYLASDRLTLRDCVALAGETIDSGRAMAQLEGFVRLSNEERRAS